MTERVEIADIRPNGSDEEIAAIVAALELVWPEPDGATPNADDEPTRWRFSGRWWTKPAPLRRDRPW
jgi:hypothetical protein